ncbi:MAG TPA: biotin/lipoyl-containing protein [Candidatus Limnocylindrales bacterium]|nr:biotin/lipoyl-containing protein [Candidatus Limnocylindrales bacterium]
MAPLSYLAGERLRLTVEGAEPLVIELDVAEAGPPAEPAPGRLLRPLPVSAIDRVEGRRRFEVVVDGWRFEVAAEPARLADLRDRARRASAEHRPHATATVRAQIPGRIVTVHVAVGDAVATGQALLSIEAMKMENEVRAPRAGTIERVAVASGDRVELGDELVVME